MNLFNRFKKCFNMKDPDKRTVLFLSLVLAITVAAIFLVWSTFVVTEESLIFSIAWVAGFGFLFLNVVYIFLLSLAHPFLKLPLLKEAYIKQFPKVALVYPIRNETCGTFERIHYSLSGNKLPNLDLWILSDSSEEYVLFEDELVAKLREIYGTRVYYRRRLKPIERKQGNMAEFLHSHPEYSYLYVADADGMVPKGVILKLLRKAEDPQNQDVAIFQCSIRIAHARTWYARFERIGTSFAQRLYFTTMQAVFGRVISFGHHHLARTKILRKIKLPVGLLSHDNWDSVLLDQLGYRVAFCPDVIAFDEAPSNYLEATARARRWAQGTLQGLPLVFKPGITPASRFFAFYGIYLYFSDLVFFFWVILGILAHSELTGRLIHFQIDEIWLGLFTNSFVKWVLFFTMGVIVFHKLVIVKTWQDFGHYLYELFFSTLIILNNFFYVPLHLVTLPLRKLHWNPMKKNPLAELRFSDALKHLWAGTLFGALGFYFCTQQTPYFVWQATPLLISLTFSIPLVYGTAKSVPKQFMTWI